MKKKIVFILILLLIIVVLAILFFVKFYKVNKIINLMKFNSDKQNYSYLEKDFYDNKIDVFMLRCNNIIICKVKGINQSIIEYYDYSNDNAYHIDNKNNNYSVRQLLNSDNKFLNFPFYKYLTLDFSFKNKLKLVFDWKIKDVKDNCYEITTKDNYKITFDKNNGLVLRVKSLEEGDKFEEGIEDFKENSVTEEDVKLPDLTEYTQIK